MQVPVRCIWRIVLPLQEMGYQTDIRLMNAVHYAVPQRREVGSVTDKEPQPCLRAQYRFDMRAVYQKWPQGSKAWVQMPAKLRSPSISGTFQIIGRLEQIACLTSCMCLSQRLIIFAAKSGYKLPAPIPPWYAS